VSPEKEKNCTTVSVLFWKICDLPSESLTLTFLTVMVKATFRQGLQPWLVALVKNMKKDL
jgi:hypothetical protein